MADGDADDRKPVYVGGSALEHLDDAVRQQVVDCVETAERMADRAPSFARQRRQRAHDLAGTDPDEVELVLDPVDPDPGSLEDLQSDPSLSIDDVTDPEWLSRRLSILAKRRDALATRAPRHGERLEREAKTLAKVQRAIATTDRPIESWHDLADAIEDDDGPSTGTASTRST